MADVSPNSSAYLSLPNALASCARLSIRPVGKEPPEKQLTQGSYII